MTEHNDLNKQIAMEAILTIRMGMEWENHQRMLCGESPTYCDDAFGSIAMCLRELLEGDKTEQSIDPSPLARSEAFVNHIKDHLAPDQEVICKICGKTISEIVGNSTEAQDND